MLSYHLAPAKGTPKEVSKDPQGKAKTTFSKTSFTARYLSPLRRYLQNVSYPKIKITYFAIVRNFEDNGGMRKNYIVCSYWYWLKAKEGNSMVLRGAVPEEWILSKNPSFNFRNTRVLHVTEKTNNIEPFNRHFSLFFLLSHLKYITILSGDKLIYVVFKLLKKCYHF